MVADATDGRHRRRSTSPSPTRPAGPARGPHLRRRRLDPAVVASSRGCCAATPASRSRPASRTTWCPTASRPSGSATTARSRRPRCGRAGWPRPRRRATVIGDGGLATLTDEDDPGAGGASRSARYLYEPDGAVIRAGLVTAVAAGVRRRAGRRAHRLRDLRRARSARRSPAATEVLEELPYREKPLRAALRERGIGTPDDQEARRRRRARAAAQAARPARRRRGDDRADPGRRARRRRCWSARSDRAPTPHRTRTTALGDRSPTRPSALCEGAPGSDRGRDRRRCVTAGRRGLGAAGRAASPAPTRTSRTSAPPNAAMAA